MAACLLAGMAERLCGLPCLVVPRSGSTRQARETGRGRLRGQRSMVAVPYENMSVESRNWEKFKGKGSIYPLFQLYGQIYPFDKINGRRLNGQIYSFDKNNGQIYPCDEYNG